jgi:S-adenosylhomocysteine hydrolase
MNQHLPVLDRIVDSIEHHAPGLLRGCGLVCVQHLLPSTLPLFRALFRAGVRPVDTFVLGKAYSSSPMVVAELRRAGCTVHPGTVPPRVGLLSDTISGDVVELWKRAGALRGNGVERVIVLDDGGRATLHVPGWATKLHATAVEQTSSGWHRTRLDASLPVVVVARSAIKLRLESPAIATAIVQAAAPWWSVGHQRAAVLGLGPIGQAVAQCLASVGWHVVAYDPNRLPPRHTDMYTVADSMSEIVDHADVLFGCTGVSALHPEHIKHRTAQSELILLSCSTEDREFRAFLRLTRAQPWVPDEDVVCRVFGRVLRVANVGCPINFHRGEEREPISAMQFTRAALLAGVFQAACISREPRRQAVAYRLDPELQEYIAQSIRVEDVGVELREELRRLKTWSTDEWEVASEGKRWGKRSGVVHHPSAWALA